MQASAGQHLPVLHCTYLCLLVFALSLLSCSAERSEAVRGRSSLHCFPVVGASVAKQSEAALNYMLESVRKFVDFVTCSQFGKYFEFIFGAIFFVMLWQCF